jgi:hypothetical protein
MVLKACQQNTLCHSGSERLDPEKQAGQSNESSPGCSDNLRSAKKVNKCFHNLTTYPRTCILFLTVHKGKVKVKVKLPLCLINQAPLHEDVWGVEV